jgi:hypothetical protein
VNERIDNPEPNVMQSKTDTADPNRNVPNADTEDPNLMKLRTLKLDPK